MRLKEIQNGVFSELKTHQVFPFSAKIHDLAKALQ